MANPEHLKILEQGVEAWNKWRENNPDIRPDLGEANLARALLSEVDLSRTNLMGANLSEASLFEADLRWADLCETNLSEAVLIKADLRWAKLRAANLDKARLTEAYLDGADLSRADLRAADLTGANFTMLICKEYGSDSSGIRATLREADLRESYLIRANLSAVDLRDANLSRANLMSANLHGAELKKANLEDADLRYCNLVKSNLSCTILTGAKLYGTARDGWIIKQVGCKYVYWDFDGEQRCPKDRDLEPGEFEKIYPSLPTIEYIFDHGMTIIDLLIMDRVVQAIREERPEFDIKIDSINARGLAPSIKFTVQHEEHKEPAFEEVRKGYEERINRLEAEKDRLYDLLGQAIDRAGDVRLITGNVVAMDNATINIVQHIHNALELQKAIVDEPEESKSFAKVAKKTALDIVGGAIKDIAKGQIKEAAKQIIELGKELGPIIAAKAAYAFFRSIGA